MNRFGGYEILGEVGRGAFGAVFRARDASGSLVALKVLLTPGRAQNRRRFEREVRALMRLEHPNVVRMYNAGEEGGRPFMAMEWVEGENLEERLEREGPWSPVEAAELVVELCAGLQHAHDAGVWHRDLKPANVMLPRSGRPKLADFGLAKDLSGSLSGASLTQQGGFMGSPLYAPPEQARGETDQVGPWSDVFGMGGILYSTLTGEPPLEAEGVFQILSALERPPTPPSRIAPGIDPALNAVCLKALAREPSKRYPSPRALQDDLERYLSGESIRSGPSPWTWVLGGAAVVGLSVAVGVGAAIRMEPSAEDPAEVAQAEPPAEPPADPPPRDPPPRDPPPRDPPPRDPPVVVPVDPPRVDPPPREPPVQVDHVAEGERLLEEGRGLWNAGDQEGALRVWEEATRHLPNDPRPWLLVGVAWEQLGDMARAQEVLIRSLRLRPTAKAYTALGGVLRRQGDLDASQAVLQEGISAFGEESAELWHQFGLTAAAQRDLATAEELYSQALRLDPQSPDSRFYRCQVRHDLGKFAEGLEDADVLVVEEPDDPKVHLWRGMCLEGLERTEEAYEAFTQAIELGKDDEITRTQRGLLSLHGGDPARALPDLARALELTPDDGLSHLNHAEALRMLERWEDAEQGYDEAVWKDPKDARVWIGRAQFFRLRGRYEEALEDYARGLALDGDWHVVRYQQALTFQELERWEEAGEDIALLVEAVGEDHGWVRQLRARQPSADGD